MVALSKLPKIVSNRKKRLGRGGSSGKGGKSGRGTTRHQKARTAIPLSFEGGQNKLTKKFPLLRGKARNKSSQRPALIVNLSSLDKLPEKTEVTIDSLIEYNILKPSDRTARIKILSKGDLTKPLIIRLPLSKTAQQKVEKAGGSVALV